MSFDARFPYARSIGTSMLRFRFVAAIATALLLFAASCSKPGSAEPKSSVSDPLPVIAVQRAELNNLSHNLALTAEFTPYQEVDVMSKVAGFIKQINVDIGDRVHKGQMLATLEVPEMTDDLTKARLPFNRAMRKSSGPRTRFAGPRRHTRSPTSLPSAWRMFRRQGRAWLHNRSWTTQEAKILYRRHKSLPRNRISTPQSSKRRSIVRNRHGIRRFSTTHK